MGGENRVYKLSSQDSWSLFMGKEFDMDKLNKTMSNSIRNTKFREKYEDLIEETYRILKLDNTFLRQICEIRKYC